MYRREEQKATDSTITVEERPMVAEGTVLNKPAVLQVGMDFHLSSLEMLQCCTLSSEEALQQLRHVYPQIIVEFAILKTCNRFELYAATCDADAAIQALLGLMQSMLAQGDASRSQMIIRKGNDVVRHLISVTAGLESALIGEYDIVAQVKRAYETSRKQGSLNTILGRLFQHAIHYSKLIRTTLGISKSKQSVSDIGTQWIKSHGVESTMQAVVVGAGETARQMLTRLAELGMKRLIVLNRNEQKAHEIAQEVGGQGAGLDQLLDVLEEADLAIFATSSSIPLLFEENLRCLTRRHRPLALLDFGMPRNIEASVSEIPWVRMLDIFSIVDLSITESSRRENWKQKMANTLEQASQEFLIWLSEYSISPLLGDLRKLFEETIFAEIEHIQARGDWRRDEDEAMRGLAVRLSGKLLHAPIVGLKEIAARESPDRAHEVGKLLFLREGNVSMSGGRHGKR